MNKSPAPIHAFRAGRHVAMSGQSVTITASDLAESARAYDPSLHEAPIVVGHPRTDAPAYGWVTGVSAEGADLFATPGQVDAQFAEMVEAGRFKKRSASFYPPDHPHNPVPGVWYLKHLGFLGAAPPSVKGLKDYQFADETDLVTVEFGEYDDTTNANLWRRLREWIIGKFGQDEADKVVPGWDVSSLEQSAQEELKDNPAPGFSEKPIQEESSMTEEERKRMAELEAENNKLKAQEAQFAESQTRLQEIEAATRRKEIGDFVAGLVTAGKVLPVDREPLVAFMEGGADTVIEFGEGDAKASKPGAEWLRDFLGRLPAQVDFSERSANTADASTADFAAPDDYTADPAALELYRQAKAHQTANPGTDFETAVRAIAKK